MQPIEEKQITDFIAQLREDMVTAEKFLVMWRRRTTATPSPMTNGKSSPALGDIDAAASAATNGTTPIAEQVRAAISKCPPRYTLRDVEGVLTADGKNIARDLIAGALNRFARNGDIHVAEKGRGRRATTFSKEDPAFS